MDRPTSADLLARLKRRVRRISIQEQIEAGLASLAATGIPIDELESLARSNGLELDDIALAVPTSSFRQAQNESDLPRMVAEIHEVIVQRQANRLASLSETERDLYEAASEDEPFGASELCHRTRIHDLDSRTKQCLSNLVKLGLLKKIRGRNGYLRTPTKVMT